MPQNARVLIAYGPYESCGLVNHKMSRLKGLETVLIKNGHTVDFEEMDDWNKVELWVNNEKIFDCDIRDLDYGSDGELDQLCQEARKKVEDAY